jgi:hypothetical protein
MSGWPTATPPPVEPLAAPVLAGERYGGRPVYYSDVIVGHDSPIGWLEELQGCSWAYNEPASHSGHTVTLYGLVRMGARPGFLARVVEAGFHQRAIGLVHTGAADTAAIDSQVLAIERRDHPRLADRRVVGSFGPSTIQPLVAASRLPAGSRTRFGSCWSASATTRRRDRCLPGASPNASPPSMTAPTTTSGPCWPPSGPPAGPPSPRRRPPADGLTLS